MSALPSDALQKPPLDGITVIDMLRVLSGRYCTMVLSDVGARVIKMERPDIGDDTRQWGPLVGGQSAYFMAFNRHKGKHRTRPEEPIRQGDFRLDPGRG
jgi:CoA:oxalate CoA-transferase